MWTRAEERRFLSHRLCSHIRDNQPQGYAVLDWESILHSNAGELGDYKELAVLPDKIARYLYEFHADSATPMRSTGGIWHTIIFNTLAIGHTKHPNEQRISSWLFAVKELRGANSQDFVFIRPPGISHGAFELRMDNVWFCKTLLLFEV
jgi:hypothetical protein